MTTFETDDTPAFAPTLHSILDRYRHAVVSKLDAVKALSSITLALAPEDMFDTTGEDQLNVYFEYQIEQYRLADGHADRVRDEIVTFVWSAAQGKADVHERLTRVLRKDI